MAWLIALPRDWLFAGGTKIPFLSFTSSGLPPTLVATTGRPEAKASSRELEKQNLVF